MDLERGVRAFQSDIVAGQIDRVSSIDLDPEWALAESPKAAAKRPVTRRLGHHVRCELVPAERRKYADQCWSASVGTRCRGYPAKQKGEFTAKFH